MTEYEITIDTGFCGCGCVDCHCTGTETEFVEADRLTGYNRDDGPFIRFYTASNNLVAMYQSHTVQAVRVA